MNIFTDISEATGVSEYLQDQEWKETSPCWCQREWKKQADPLLGILLRAFIPFS